MDRGKDPREEVMNLARIGGTPDLNGFGVGMRIGVRICFFFSLWTDDPHHSSVLVADLYGYAEHVVAEMDRVHAMDP